jgi:hypothetical protein
MVILLWSAHQVELSLLINAEIMLANVLCFNALMDLQTE